MLILDQFSYVCYFLMWSPSHPQDFHPAGSYDGAFFNRPKARKVVYSPHFELVRPSRQARQGSNLSRHGVHHPQQCAQCFFTLIWACGAVLGWVSTHRCPRRPGGQRARRVARRGSIVVGVVRSAPGNIGRVPHLAHACVTRTQIAELVCDLRTGERTYYFARFGLFLAGKKK